MPNVADKTIARLESLLNSMPSQAQNDPRYQEAQRQLDMMKALNDNPVTGTMIDVGIQLHETIDSTIEEISDIVPDLGDAGLKFVRGLGGAVVDAGVGMYDTVAHRMSGKSTEIISSLTIATVTILTVVYLFNAAKSGKV